MPKFAQGLRERLLDSLNFQVEYDELLGPGKGQKRRCYNKEAHAHGDQTPSLFFSPKHGGYKCGSCGETGDMFTLYMKVNGWTYPQTMEYLLKKAGLWTEADPTQYESRTTNRGAEALYKPLTSKDVRAKLQECRFKWNEDRYAFMFKRYGLTKETLNEYHIAPTDGHPLLIQIPIFQSEHLTPQRQLPRLLNIRKHDVFRNRCQWYNKVTQEVLTKRPESISIWDVAAQNFGDWEPQWKDKAAGSKVVNVTGHGATYLYPFDILYKNAFVYLVGGELKALLLIQLGVPAITFTSGEGQFARDLLPFFLGKRVRVLMDYDDAGVRGAATVAQEVADYGGYVEVGTWNPELTKLLPPKGDVTDLLRLTQWNPSVLDDANAITWTEVAPRTIAQEIKENTIGEEEIPPWKDFEDIAYDSLVDPAHMDLWVKLKVTVSGRESSPHAVPHEVTAYCERGRSNPIPDRCPSCACFAQGGELTLRFAPLTQVEMAGKTGDILKKEIKNKMKVPDRCAHPDLKIRWGSVEFCTAQAPFDTEDGSPLVEKYSFDPRGIYVVSTENKQLEDNKTYHAGGKIIQDPRSGKFTLAAVDMVPSASKIFQWGPIPELHSRLHDLTHTELGYRAIMNDLRDNVASIYEVDAMLLAEVLPFFMPFQFELGTVKSERVCPAVMILGDSNVAKSTAVRRFMQHFGAGRYLSSDSEPTFAGLVGGYMNYNGRPIFNWGLLPMSHRGLAALDEFQMLEVEDIAKLGNTVTTGVAERATAYGVKRAPSHVRLVYLSNPRGQKRLTQYKNPLDAVREVMGTTQALGRLEYAHVEFGAERGIFKRLHEYAAKGVTHQYTTDVARYHLQWAWNLKPQQYYFVDHIELARRAADLAEEFNDHPLLFSAQSRWKVARVAAAFAALSFSVSPKLSETVLRVTQEHVEMALNFLRGLYKPWMLRQLTQAEVLDPTPETDTSPLYRLFNLACPGRQVDKLQLLVSSDKWTQEDLQDIFHRYTGDFVKLAQIDLGLISRKRNDYMAKDERMSQVVVDYFIIRDNTAKRRKS